MSNFEIIQNKLEQFIRKYYTNELIKGAILFFSIGLLYFLLTLLVEYFLWLNPTARTVLFWLFITVELALFVRFIVMPLAQLFRLKNGINFKQASNIIGNHFPQVNDKLLNVLQLNDNSAQSELLLASIEQKSAELKPIPFKLAIDFKTNFKYLKYTAIPLLIVLLVSISGNFNWFSDGYERVLNYQTAYEPPAPFQFFVVNENLNAIENKDFKLIVKTAGEVIPDNAQITYNNETYFLQQIVPGEFQYIFSQPKQDIDFKIEANDIRSRPYTLNVVEVPTLLGFEMVLDYPSYTKKRDETLKSTGNATVPQGTSVTWKLRTKSTDQAFIYAKDTLAFSSDDKGFFNASKRVYNDLDYNISTSNSNLRDYENLAFSIDVVVDEYPELNVQVERDSIDQQTLYFFGQVSDDYGLSKLQLVYYPSDNDQDKTIMPLPISKSNFDEFISSFPGNITVEDGVSYELYFEAFDNDVIHNYKKAKSTVYTFRKLTKDEEEQQQLEQQNETIKDLNKALDKFEEQEKDLEELSKTQKEKSELNFNDKKKFENFLKRQKEQEQLMQNFNKKLQDNLEEFQKESQQDKFKEQLKERLEENQNQLKQDEKLLKELEKLAEKIQKEEFSEKLEKLAKQNKNQKRSLQQMLELTKRYYVGKKMEKLQQELEKLAEKQEKLSKETEEKNTKEEQEKLNKEFEDFQKEMNELEKENKELKKPMPLPRDENEEKSIEDEQKEAAKKLEEKEQSQDQQQKQEKQKGAQKSQQKAAQKMKQMSKKMGQSMQMSGGEQNMEDAETLRQILDNLVLFSFDQEALMKQFKGIEINHNEYAKYLRKQSNLREHFQHIDDSLFALSLRQPKISEMVNKEITEVFFNIDKSLGQLAENRLYQGVATQQYTVTAANNLADMLSNSLDNMQMQMSGSGSGQSSQPGQQLPDIIMSQEQLNEQMKDGMKQGGKEGEKQEGEEGKEGDKGKEGKEKGRQQGNQGEQQGEGGSQGNESENGRLFEIYQEQQRLRQALEEQLKNMKGNSGTKGQAEKLVKDMEEIELDLINKGFTDQTLQKMMKLQHQLLKLDNAAFQQGQDNKRKSRTNADQFKNNTNNTIPKAKEYFNTTEILNRQALPLQQKYKKKVQDYFKQKQN